MTGQGVYFRSRRYDGRQYFLDYLGRGAGPLARPSVLREAADAPGSRDGGADL